MRSREALAVDDDRVEFRIGQESSVIRQEIASVRADMATRKDLETLRQEMTGGFARLERQITESRVEIVKWSFLFWTGQCFVIIGFLLVFLRNR